MGDIGPDVTISASRIEEIARAVAYEATIARQCAAAGRANDPQRALSILRKINAMTSGLAVRP